MQQSEITRKFTFEEYLQLEEETNQKYEFHDGSVYAMAGGSLNHSLIARNLVGNLHPQLKNGNCQIMNNDLKLKIETKSSYLYPDAMIVCGDLDMSDTENEAIKNPKVIIEVLSKSTQGYDRGDKFSFYRLITALEYYILIEQNKVQVEVYKRGSKSNRFIWELTVIEGLESTLSLSLSETETITIKLSDIYFKTKFE
jgi:Uma2 family endonuclease